MPNVVEAKEDDTTGFVSALISISKSTRALHGLKLAALGFHNGQDELMLVASEAGCTVSWAAARLAIRPSTVSKMTDRLVARVLMERVSDHGDARRTIIRLTPAGTVARRKLVNLRRELEADLSKALPDETRATILMSLGECQAHLTKRLQRLR